MKDENETRGDARWQALAESLKSDDEPPRQAEVIRAQFRRKIVEKDLGTAVKNTPSRDEARRPAAEESAGNAQPAGGMSRPELIAHLRSALQTLEQDRPAQKEPGAKPDPGQSQPAGKQNRLKDRQDLPVFAAAPASSNTEGAHGNGSAGAPRPNPANLEGSQAGAVTASKFGANASQLPTPRLQFSQEVPDFLRSRDIAWPSASKSPRRDRGAAPRSRLEALYPEQISDPREAPPPWVKNKNTQARPKRRAWLVSVSAAAALVLTLALGTTWVVTRSEATARVSAVESIQSWFYRAGSSAANGARETGAVIQALLPFGDDQPPIQSIILLPKNGQQPPIRTLTPDASRRPVAVPIQTDARAATELPSIAYESAPSNETAPEAFALTIAPASGRLADGPEPDRRPLDETLRATPGIVATEKAAGLADPPDGPGAEIAALSPRVDTETSIQGGVVLLPTSPNPQRALESPPAVAVEPRR